MIGSTLLALALLVGADSVTLTPHETTIGAPVTLRIEVNLREGERVATPIEIPPPGEAELLSAATSPVERGEGGRWRQTITLRIGFYATGKRTVPPFVYTIIKPDGSREARNASAQKVTIRSVRENKKETTLAPFRDVIDVERRPAQYLVDILLAVAAVALVTVLFLWVRRKFLGREKKAPVMVIPPHEKAFRRLDEIEKENLPLRGQTKQFAFALSEIVREYIENRFGLPALERSTAELREELPAEKKIPIDLCLDFLEGCDIIKFTDIPPGEGEPARLMRLARLVVTETKEGPA